MNWELELPPGYCYLGSLRIPSMGLQLKSDFLPVYEDFMLLQSQKC